jgi:serine/threonine protein kinase
VALKVMAADLVREPGFRERFQRESRIAASLDHPHVVPVHHAGEEDGLLYVTMRFIEGTDLRELLRSSGRLETLRAVTIVHDVAGALDEAHRRGLVHRDVKPANVLIGRDERAFLTDFGVSKSRANPSELTGTGLAVGSADYMAPEQAHGIDVDGRADVYSLGCVLYQALTGAVPYDRDSDLDKLWAHVHEPPPALLEVRPDLPERLGDVLSRSMAKDPAARHATAGELGREALAAVGG